MNAVIMAGGKGTRIASLNDKAPKPMIPVAGKPVLAHQIEELARQGITDIILVVGYKHESIEEYFGTDGSNASLDLDGKAVHIRYLVEEQPLGTAGILYFLKDIIQEDFLMINGDIIFNIDIVRLQRAHRMNCEKGALATIFTHPNQHPYDSGLVITNTVGCVEKWLHKEDERTWYHNRINAGIHLISPALFPFLTEKGMLEQPEKLDLDRDVLRLLIPEQKLYAYDSPEYVKDMGTPDRYHQVEEDLRNGRVKSGSLKSPKKAVFLDRDGTINKYAGFLRKLDQFELIDGAAEAISLIKRQGFLVIVVTNQPVIARGEVSFEELDQIHQKMETLLGQKGAYVDAVYFCPHHPDRGFEGERVEYKTECECRKPKPGMLIRAAKEYNIDLEQSWMVGDRQSDILAGKNAGCRTAGVGGCMGGEVNFDNLLDFSEYLCQLEEYTKV